MAAARGVNDPPRAISVLARFGNGVALPMVLFVLWQWVLIASTSGTGSWAGMTVFFTSLVTVPALLVLDSWVLAVRWRGHFRAFFAGLALPAIVGAAEFYLMHGGSRRGSLGDAVLASPLAPLVLIALAVPLIAATTLAIGRRRRERRAGREVAD